MLQAFSVHFPEQTFHLIEPRTAGGSVMDMESRTLSQPSLYVRVFVRRVVVDNEMNLFVGWRVFFNQGQELNPLLIGVYLVKHVDNLAAADILCREQSGRSIAFVIVRFGRRVAWRARQAVLCPHKRLELTLFVRRTHNRVVRRIQIQFHDIGGFLGKKWVVGRGSPVGAGGGGAGRRGKGRGGVSEGSNSAAHGDGCFSGRGSVRFGPLLPC